MGATFVITLREAFEASLLLGIIYSCLDRVGARASFHWVTLGAVLGLAASLAMGLGVSLLSGPLIDLGPDLVGAAIMFLAVVLLTWHAWWMRQHARTIKGDVEQHVSTAHASQRIWVVGLIAFTGVFREGAETVLFLWGLMVEATSAAGWGNVAGGLAGVTVAAGLGWAVFRGGQRVSLPRFFAWTTALILLLAAGLFSTGVGRLEGLGLLPMTDPVWDTSWLLSDKSVVGSFLTGLVGYRARPSLFEVLAYWVYLVGAGTLLFRRRPAAPRRPPSARIDLPLAPDPAGSRRGTR
jgi:high-affinity iron transporter